MSHFRLTPRAIGSLASIFEWTIAHFGEDQAEHYRDALIKRCRTLAQGHPPHGRPCDVLLKGRPDAKGLLYFREGGHFILYQRHGGGIVVIDFVHERRNLPRMIERIKQSDG